MDDRSARAMAAAMQWVGRILAVACAMAAPPALGTYLDDRWQTRWLSPAGVAVGLVTGIALLIAMTRTADKPRDADPRDADIGPGDDDRNPS